MFILLISILFAVSAYFAIQSLVSFISSFELQRKISTKISQTKDSFQFKGITGILFFLAQKLGEFLEKKNYDKLNILTKDISNSTSVLGKPYNTIQPYTYISFQIFSGLGLTIFLSFILSTANFALLAAFMALGFFLPYYILKEKVKDKHKAIFRQIPDVLDLLTLMIEAGLDFNAALNRIVTTEKGELVDEFSTVLQEIKLGKPRMEAYSDMAKRINYTPLSSVISSITNALNSGGSMGGTFRTLSAQFRIERSQLAEKLAGEAPLKLMFPLVIFIFPTIFIVIFGPIIISFMTTGGF